MKNIRESDRVSNNHENIEFIKIGKRMPFFQVA